MAQERKVKENELRYLESERRRHLAEKRLRSAMRGLDESNRREAELQSLLEGTLEESERNREQAVIEFRQSLEFKAFIKGALESSVNMFGSALLDRGLVSREDLEGLDMNECILSRSHSYQCSFFNMSAERMGRMFAFVSNMKAVIPPTEAEMAGAAEGVPAPEEDPAPGGEGVPAPEEDPAPGGEGVSEGTSEGPLAVSPLHSRDPLQDVPRTPGADLVVDFDPESFEEE
ncbi:hypothetical protein AXF42_Ash017909 [Apostasia shenzhenica]|uniref:Uncharacterized protein n=1 Tax=Apostasia shenzhenica TaxID=1088818 RepID=A0A2I0AY75_9ASPA|nr:hypothetical protein AXF42_Ash017909 [Apostasia shenzhenica]